MDLKLRDRDLTHRQQTGDIITPLPGCRDTVRNNTLMKESTQWRCCRFCLEAGVKGKGCKQKKNVHSFMHLFVHF